MRQPAAFGAVIVAISMLAGCMSSKKGTSATPAQQVTVTQTVAQPEHSKSGKHRSFHKPSHSRSRSRNATGDGSFTMPNEVGKNLQAAQDDIQRVSGDPIFFTHSRDATGEDRFQILDSDWKVCSQNVAPGTRASGTEHIVFSVVKLDEACP